MRLQSVKLKEDANDNQEPNPLSFTMQNDLRQMGLTGLAAVHHNFSPSQLY